MLDYDNSAFYYFAITMITIYLIPGTWYALGEVYRAFISSGEVGIKPRTAAEKEKADKLKRETTGIARLKRSTFIVNLILLVVFWSLLVYLVTMVITDGQVQAFDPYHILGIEQGAASGDIKKAYRKLSLKFHPDKNIGDKMAEEIFMKIAKAYEALTDETSKENYEKYGNPDGKQSLEVSIGLPKIILENPKIVLVLYLVAMVVIIPVVVGIWYANSKQYGENNIKYESYTAFYQLIADSHRTKNMPEVMAASAECRAINTTKPGDNEPLKVFYEKMKNEKLMVKPKFEHPVILRGNLLIHAHLLRLTQLLTPALREDLDAMLIKGPELVEGMIEICHQRRWLETTLSAIKFSQCIIQALFTGKSPLLQVPHLTDAAAKEITQGCTDPTNALNEFLRTPDAQKKGLGGLSAKEKEDVFEACKLIPCMKFETKLFVEEEEKDFYEDDPDATPALPPNPDAPKGDSIYEQDLVTLRVTLTHENVSVSTKKGVEARLPPVYAPHFPKTVREGWWVILTDKSSPEGARKQSAETTIHAIEKITDQKRVVSHELRFMAPQRAGSYEMELHVYSDSYMGLDVTIPLNFTVRPADELPEYEPHPEDVELDNEPTLFEQVMAANVDDSSDDEEEEKPAAPIAVKKEKKEKKEQARVIELAGEDSEED